MQQIYSPAFDKCMIELHSELGMKGAWLKSVQEAAHK